MIRSYNGYSCYPVTNEEQRRNARIRKYSTLSPCRTIEDLLEWGQTLINVNDSNNEQVTDDALQYYNQSIQMKLPLLPHVIESTAALAQIRHRDNNNNNISKTTIITEMELRLLYSSAIIRTVNGLADTLQQQRAIAGSVAILCTELGVPNWIVDIRHEATHNQLPSLSTLRMATNALLQYFYTVYWEPLQQARNDAYEQIMYLFIEYDKVAKQYYSSKLKNQVIQEDISSTNTDNDDIDDIQNEEVQVKKKQKWFPNPGIQANPFAILMETSKKSKITTKKDDNNQPQKNMKEMIQNNTLPNKKRKMFRKQIQPGEPTPNNLAQQIIKEKVPIDIIYDAALDFFIYFSSSSSSNNNNDNDSSSLNKNNYSYFCDDDVASGALVECTDFDQSMKLYRVLIVILGKVYRGFICALLNRCIDVVIYLDKNIRKATTTTTQNVIKDQLCMLEKWIHFFLSIKFAIQIDPKVKQYVDNKIIINGFAPISIINDLFKFPLNSLCDRLLLLCNNGNDGTDDDHHNNDSNMNNNKSTKSTRHSLYSMFCIVLGSQRVKYHGIDAQLIETMKQDQATTTTTKTTFSNDERSEQKQQPTTTTIMSLDEMEAFLTEDKCLPTPNKKCKSIGWVRCTSWDPCSIGTLPGIPMRKPIRRNIQIQDDNDAEPENTM